MIFQTSRLTFRLLVSADLDALAQMYADPEMREFFPDGVRNCAETQEELEYFLNGHPKHPDLGLWAAVRRSDNALIGRGGLLPWEIDGVNEVEIAYMVDKPFWRQGYGSEMARGLIGHGFCVTGADRLIALTDQRHAASIRTAESAGLRFWKSIVMDGTPSEVYRVDRPCNVGTGESV